MSTNSDWMQFYQNNGGEGILVGHGNDQRGSYSNMTSSVVADATVVTTTTTPALAGGGAHLNPAEGRVSKPTRRRRASRAAPTTLLNTDTTNFRAMVQQFTGVPNAPFAFSQHSNSPNMSFGSAGGHQMMPHTYFNHPSQQQQQQRPPPQQQQQQYIFSLNNNNEGYGSVYNNNRPNTHEASDDDGFFIDNVSSSSHQVVFIPRSSNSNSDAYTM